MSSSTTDMLASAERPVVYGSHGGIEPATLEWLVLESSGRAVYSAANPWPRSAPYDEIGTYSLDGAAKDVLAAAGTIAARNVAVPAASSPDAGSEYLDLFVDGHPWSAEWVAQRAPESIAHVVDRLRTLIDTLRGHPVRTLRASLMQQGGEVHLRLHNRGDEPFRFRGFGTGHDDSSLHGEMQRSAQLKSVDRLADDAPLRLAAAPRLGIARTDREITLEGGQDVALRITGLPGRGRLECLVHVRLHHEGLGRQTIDDGWIWPEALDLRKS